MLRIAAPRPKRCVSTLFILGSIATCFFAGAAHAQLRIVTYNTANGFPTGITTARPEAATVLQAIGEELTGGVAWPIDALLLQEQFSVSGSTQSFVDMMNGIYGPGVYKRSNIPAQTSDSQGRGGGPALVYNSNTLELVDEMRFGLVNGSNQTRSTLRYQMRPMGYDQSADFYLYNNHYKASTGTANQERRRIEAAALRDNSDALGEGTHAIYAGDYNMTRSTEPAFQELISSGPGQAFDPVNQLGNWSENSSFAEWHTQSTCENACTGGFAGSGVDDRFDFQLVTGELLDGEGLSYLPGSYHTFGNDGTTYNDAINVGNDIEFSGITSFTKSQVLDALESASDHLPVVADYQLPAVLEALTGVVPTMLNQGQAFDLDLFVRNAADVLTTAGADELDFSFTTTGALSGSASGVANPLASASAFPITLDTSTEGFKSGSIVVTTDSQGAANSFLSIPISYQVGSGSTLVEQVVAQAVKPAVADDMNVLSFQFGGDFTALDVETPAGNLPVGSDAVTLAFSSSADMFGIEDRNDGPPSDTLDNSEFGNDSYGIIQSTDTNNFFGVADIENDDNSGSLTAEWSFDISSAVGGLTLSIDIAAMGDFEADNDIFLFEISIDGSPFSTAFDLTVDESTSQTYTLEDGDSFELNDPLELNGVLLDNLFETFTKSLAGVGDSLVLRFTAAANADDEAFAFRNVEISGLVDVGGLAGDYNDDGVVNIADYTVWRDSLGATVANGSGADGDPNGVIDAGDYAVWKENFGMSSDALVSQPQQVPESASLLLVALPVGCFLTRCRPLKLSA